MQNVTITLVKPPPLSKFKLKILNTHFLNSQLAVFSYFFLNCQMTAVEWFQC